MRLDDSFKNQCFTFSKVLCASSYGHLLQEKNFGPNVIYHFFLMSGGPRADELDLEVDFGVVLGFAVYLPHICVRSTSSRPQVDL